MKKSTIHILLILYAITYSEWKLAPVGDVGFSNGFTFDSAIYVQTSGKASIGPYLYKSTDNGETWEKTTDFGIGSSLIYQVQLSEDSTYLIIITQDSIFTFRDGQSVYRDSLRALTKQPTGEYVYESWQPYMGSQIVPLQNYWFAASYNFGLAVSKDDGHTWYTIQPCSNDTSPDCIYDNFQPNGTIAKCGMTLIAGTVNGVISSTDFGKTWKEDTLGAIVYFAVHDNGQIFAATNTPAIFMSPDTAKTWIPVNDGYPLLSYGKHERLREMAAFDNKVYIVLQTGVYVFNNNMWVPAGADWPAQIRPVHLFFSNNALFCTSTDGIYRLQNYSWKRINADFDGGKGGVNTVFFHENELWAGGWHGIFCSKDSGITWENRSMGIENEFYIMDLASTNFGLFSGTLGQGLYKWDMMLQVWKQIRYDNYPQYQTGYFVRISESKRGLYVQQPWGQSLLLIDTERELIDSVSSFNSMVICAAGDTLLQGADHGLFRSYNAGKTWDATPLLYRFVSDVIKKGPVIVYGDPGSQINYSKDNGVTWDSAIVPSNFSNGRQLAFNNGVWYALTSDHLNYSTDTCKTWTNIPLPPAACGGWFKPLAVMDGLIAVGSETGLWINYTDTPHSGKYGYQKLRVSPVHYRICRDNIQIDLNKKGVLTIDALDLNGRKMFSLNSGMLESGSHQIRFPQNYASGILIMRLSLNGKCIALKRVIRE